MWICNWSSHCTYHSCCDSYIYFKSHASSDGKKFVRLYQRGYSEGVGKYCHEDNDDDNCQENCCGLSGSISEDIGWCTPKRCLCWVDISPLFAAFIVFEVASLPEKMGRKVSSAVKAELDGEFKNINTSIANHLMSSMSTSIVSTLAHDIAKDDSIKEMFNHLIKGQKKNIGN